VRNTLKEAKKMTFLRGAMHAIRSTIFFPATWIIERVIRLVMGQ
jgi:hypothetical protein